MIGFKNTSLSSGNTPSVSTLGKIKLTDFTGATFTDLPSAIAYVEQFTNAELTETSFADQTFYFTVPANTSFFNRSDFCSKNDDTDNLQFEDNDGLVVTFKEDAFNGNKKNNIVKNSTFSISAFSGTSGNNSVENCVFQDAFNEVSSGNNSIKNCDFVDSSFRYYEGNADFIGDYEFTDFSFLDAKGNFTFQDNTVTGVGCFVGAYGNFDFGSNGNFGNETFRESFANANFGKNNLFGANSFESATGFISSIDNATFGNTCFNNATGNAKLLGNNIFGTNCFENANPTIKNEIQNIVSCGSNFALNYFGRFDVLSTLGINGLQTLPNDIFTTAQIVNFNYPNALNYNNAGGKDGDLVKALENISNLKSVINSIVNYSTDEVYTGQKWIDGKPIYRKVFAIYFTQLQSELIFTHYLDVSLENIENIIRTSTYANDSDGTLQNDFTEINTNNNLIANFLNSYIESDSGNIISTGRLNSLTETTGYIILEYTKTTD